MGSPIVFDQPHYNPLNVAREDVLRRLLASFRRDFELRTAVDFGCGVGYFASILHELGFEVLALDGRQENINEAMRRCAGVEFRVADAEDTAIRAFGKFDLALFFGIFYHLENPFLAVRNLFAMTGRVAILEGICVPGEAPVFALRDEGPSKDQGLRHVALCPTEAGLIKLLYRAGYSHVFRLAIVPDHPDYSASSVRRRARTILVASVIPLSSDLLELAREPMAHPDPWDIRNTLAAFVVRAGRMVPRLWRFVRKPWPEKQRILRGRWRQLFSSWGTREDVKVSE
jgi:SAM-dependent methyltransferase